MKKQSDTRVTASLRIDLDRPQNIETRLNIQRQTFNPNRQILKQHQVSLDYAKNFETRHHQVNLALESTRIDFNKKNNMHMQLQVDNITEIATPILKFSAMKQGSQGIQVSGDAEYRGGEQKNLSLGLQLESEPILQHRFGPNSEVSG